MKKLSLVLILTLCGLSVFAIGPDSAKPSDAEAAVETAPESAPAEAQDPSVFEAFPRALGFEVSAMFGSGIAYRQWFNRLGYQVCAGVLAMPETMGGNKFEYWVAAEGYFSLFRTEFTSWLYNQLYLFTGLMHGGRISYLLDSATGLVTGTSPFEPSVNFGVGIGIELGLFRHFSAVFELGYAAHFVLGPSFWDSMTIDLSPGGTFLYRF